MKRFLTIGLLLLSTPLFAQSLPDRSNEVRNLVTGKYAGMLNGDENRRREVLGLVCGDLNLIDGGKWGFLIKSDRNPPFIPSDILVWQPTREHVDVLTDNGPAWIVHEAIPAQWNWQICPAAAPTPTPGPLPAPTTPPVSSIDPLLKDLQQRMIDLQRSQDENEARAEAFRQAVGHEWAKFGKFIAKYGPIVAAAVAGGKWWGN